jgi:hypothetical protein
MYRKQMSTSDQRKKSRISMVATAVVTQSPPQPPTAGYVINISYGGVGLYVKDPVRGRVQTTINLHVGRKRIPVTVSGHVTWEKTVGLLYAVGISFEGLNPQDHYVLLSFLESFQPFDQGAGTKIDPVPSWMEQSTQEEDTIG